MHIIEEDAFELKQIFLFTNMSFESGKAILHLLFDILTFCGYIFKLGDLLFKEFNIKFLSNARLASGLPILLQLVFV